MSLTSPATLAEKLTKLLIIALVIVAAIAIAIPTLIIAAIRFINWVFEDLGNYGSALSEDAL